MKNKSDRDTDTRSISDVDSQDGGQELTEPIAPDGGWGWVVLFASFLSSVIVDGVCFAFGIFYLQFLDTFQENKGKTAWIGSVLNGTYMIMGPIAGALANRFGCRIVAVVGSFWAAIAFFLSTFSTDINLLILTYGVLGGMGFGLMYLPSIVMVGYYFDKRRAFATGVATCGSGIGTFIFAPLCKYLIDVYAWKGAMWLVAGIVLNGMIIGLFYRPITERDMTKLRNKWYAKQAKLAANENEAQMDDIHQCNNEIESSSQKYSNQPTENTNDKNNFINSSHSLSYINSSSNLQTMKYLVGDSWHSLHSLANAFEAHKQKQRIQINEDKIVEKTPVKIKPAHATHQGSGCYGLIKELMANISQTMDVSMLGNPVFVIYGFSCILCMAGFFVPFIYLPDHNIEMGYDANRGAFLLSILGITNTIGRIMAGWISDRPWADCLIINNCALVVGGVATCLVPFCTNYVFLALYASVFGLCIAAFVSLRSIILVDLIGLEKLTSAFGIIVLCQGITSFVGAPIAGSLYDLTGSYDISFYVAGIMVALGGIICFPLRRLARWQDMKKCKKENDLGQFEFDIHGTVDEKVYST